MLLILLDWDILILCLPLMKKLQKDRFKVDFQHKGGLSHFILNIANKNHNNLDFKKIIILIY